MAALTLLFATTAHGQYSFRESIHISGRCDGVDQAIINAINGQIPEISGFATRAECEAARAYVNSIRSSWDGCTAYVSASPCVGHDIGGESVSGIATPTVGASTQGSSFFYTNAPAEVKNWEEEQNRIDAVIGNQVVSYSSGLSKTADDAFNATLNKELSHHFYSSTYGLNSGSGVFAGIPSTPLLEVGQNADMAAVMTYMSEIDDAFLTDTLLSHPSEIYALLPAKYKDITGYDIDVILNKEPSSRSPKEQAALDNYNAYVKEVCSRVDDYAKQKLAEIDATPEKKEIDMALLCELEYNKDETADLVYLTNYRLVNGEQVLDAPISRLLEAIERGNAREETGFHADLFYNDFTKEYSVVFRGSNDLSKIPTDPDARADWIKTNFANALGMRAKQFDIAESIANVINLLPGDVKINITGHSLGGALASYVGLKTADEGIGKARNVYTFNSEGLNPTLLQSVKNYDDSKIQAFHSSYEVLTNLQKGLYVASDVTANVASNIMSDSAQPAIDIGAQTLKLTVPGKEINLENRGVTDFPKDKLGHSMTLITETLLNRNKATQTEWSDTHAYRKAIASARENSALYRQDSLSIISY